MSLCLSLDLELPVPAMACICQLDSTWIGAQPPVLSEHCVLLQVENAFDPSHGTFLHEGILGNKKNAAPISMSVHQQPTIHGFQVSFQDLHTLPYGTDMPTLLPGWPTHQQQPTVQFPTAWPDQCPMPCLTPGCMCSATRLESPAVS